MHALFECPYTSQLWRRMELWLRTNVNKNIEFADKEKIFGYTEKQDNFIINMVIQNTKIVVYKKQQDGSIMKVIDVLRSFYKEMNANEYDSEVCSQKSYEQNWEKWENLLCTLFTKKAT